MLFNDSSVQILSYSPVSVDQSITIMDAVFINPLGSVRFPVDGLLCDRGGGARAIYPPSDGNSQDTALDHIVMQVYPLPRCS